jgi:predicted RNase H-like nuclease (RuvC/YqgF family)
VNWGDVLVSVAQVAAGGTIVQAVVALTKRRSELKQLDRGSDSVAVETADHVVVLLRTELSDTKAENKELKAQLGDQQRQIQALAEQVSALRADLAIARAEIARLQNG